MAALSNYAENALGNLLLRGVAFTAPANVYVALFTTAPGEDASGTEVSGGSYGRKIITFGAPTDGVFLNDSDATFGDMPASTVTHWAIFDAASGGNMLYHGAWASSKTYTGGATAYIGVGQISITHK